jgi:inorganic phosphate transporter, PiT family
VELTALVFVVGIALLFNYTNGFHDAANAIATSVSTRALTPRAALALAAAMNLLGAFLGTGVAKTVGSGIIDPPKGTHGLAIVAAALVGAIGWNLITWSYGLPSSSTYGLVGGLIGAALAASGSVLWGQVLVKVVLWMVLSPVIGLIVGYSAMLGIMWTFRRSHPGRVGRRFRIAQALSAAAMALGHGLQDAQKTMGVIVLALITTGHQGMGDTHVPVWVTAASAVVLSFGTYVGGWRIMRTLGSKVIALDPPKGFAAEATAASVLYATAFVWHAPVSTTHTITAAIMGVGSTKRRSAVRWGVAGDIVTAWVLTIPAAGVIAAVAYAAIALL